MTGYYDPRYEEKLEAEIEAYKGWMKRRERIMKAVREMIVNRGCIKLTRAAYEAGREDLGWRMTSFQTLRRVFFNNEYSDGCIRFRYKVSEGTAEEIADGMAELVKWRVLEYDEETGEFDGGPGDPSREWIGW